MTPQSPDAPEPGGRPSALAFLLPRRSVARRRTLGVAASIALHIAAVAALTLRLQYPETAIVSPAAGREPTIEILDELPTESAEQGSEELAGDREAIEQLPEENVDAGGFTFNIAKIRARSDRLFPFLTTDLRFLERMTRATHDARESLVSPYAREREADDTPALDIGDAALQEVVDRAWTRRERWQHFKEIVGLVDEHDGDRGRVPEVIREYLDQNILQPFCDSGTRDPRFWAMLENASDHADFLDFVSRYARTHPSSKTTTELLFLLDELAQASRQALLLLMTTDPEQQLKDTARSNPQGYDLALALRSHYQEWLSEHGLPDGLHVQTKFDDFRLRLLTTILANAPDGYRSADALFLGGEILYNQGDVTAALRWWRDMRPRRDDSYYVEAAEIVRELGSGGAGGVNGNAVRRILDSTYSRWRRTSLDRLRRFGSSCESF